MAKWQRKYAELYLPSINIDSSGTHTENPILKVSYSLNEFQLNADPWQIQCRKVNGQNHEQDKF